MLSFTGASRLSARRMQVRSIAPSSLTTTCRINTLTLPCRRHFHFDGPMLLPVAYPGLFLALWTWKCLMMVAFQNKIIWMPGLPPNARREKIADYTSRCGGIPWREERIRAADGTDLALCVADVDARQGTLSAGPDVVFYILYFQGNTSSLPPRLPDLSSVLLMLKRHLLQEKVNVKITFLCLSYRGYWTSRGRPTEKGVRLDAAAALHWVDQEHEKLYRSSEFRGCRPIAEVILWGQSVGSGVATNLAAEHSMPTPLRLDSMILETPFTSVRAMLGALYPQKWLPYKYLWPFLRNHLDSWKNLEVITGNHAQERPIHPEVLILEAARDELVPAELSQKLYDRCHQVGLLVTRRSVAGAFHNDTMVRAEGRRAVFEFVASRIMASSRIT
ncbi:alpha/beta-hydrolase [Xylariomycetidae sp. FL2044]|nr:alpha/beta-hydrolase [Xylariomycetidae sp. FL2044]